MPLSYSSKLLILLSMLIPLLVVSGGCAWLLFPKGFYDVKALNETCCNPLIAEDAIHLHPPTEVFWKWIAKTARRGPEGYISPAVDPSAVSTDLRGYLANDSGGTPAAFFSSLGMSCGSAGARTSCEYDLRVSYVCARQTPKPEDFNHPREGRIHLLIVADHDNLESAAATLQKTDGTWPCVK